MTKPKGTVYLVGAGPGDPGLVTVRGVECIQRAEVIVYDYLSNPALHRYAQPDAEIIYAGKQALYPELAAPIKLAPPHTGPERRKSA